MQWTLGIYRASQLIFVDTQWNSPSCYVLFASCRRNEYMGNVDLPVFRRKVHEYTVPKLVSILSEGVSQEKVCTTKPVSVEHNCMLVVAFSCVRDPSDLRAYDSGVWRHRGVCKTWMATDKSSHRTVCLICLMPSHTAVCLIWLPSNSTLFPKLFFAPFLLLRINLNSLTVQAQKINY